jgi:hypothetical protein
MMRESSFCADRDYLPLDAAPSELGQSVFAFPWLQVWGLRFILPFFFSERR